MKKAPRAILVTERPPNLSGAMLRGFWLSDLFELSSGGENSQFLVCNVLEGTEVSEGPIRPTFAMLRD